MSKSDRLLVKHLGQFSVGGNSHEHRHSAIRFVTPTQRHAGLDTPMLEKRTVVYSAARHANPNRWSGTARNWHPITEVHLNPNTPKPMEQQNLRETA